MPSEAGGYGINPSEVGGMTLYQAHVLFATEREIERIGDRGRMPDLKAWVDSRKGRWIKYNQRKRNKPGPA